MVATSEVSVSLTIDSADRLPPVLDELREFAEVRVDEDQAIVCIVGENIRDTPGVAARVFHSLGPVNVRMVSQGASALNFGIRGRDGGSARGRPRHCMRSSSPNSIRRCSTVIARSHSMPNLALVGYGKMGRMIDQLAPRVRIHRDGPRGRGPRRTARRR